ncbi:hypothetical protein BBK82_43605 [Lentzea guizhouensis]|uniref:Uncharacterized protein n=1 Tax=Lentzea guizhouensis TaxID=1586287 RepID=A0A1B2HVT1_9PSEU|nr:hypothetical protein BBK82_43605 [Lentzea guizhouensis]
MGEQKKSRSHAAVAGLVLAAGMCSLVGWTAGVVVVAGTWVVPDWAVSGGLLVVAFAVALIRWVRMAWPFGLVAVGTSLAVALSWVGDRSATYTVLPAAPGGCHVVVRETSFLFAGDGEVFLTTPLGIGLGRGTYVTDDGYRPVTVGNYVFGWENGIGSLRLTGKPGDPILRSSVRTLEC